ncbi:response regulator [Maribellus comscasis]|uniref:histidine kinase n=1 Tax=Maribellus comscasis TaxID=2681766 RepID=A0A6I6JQ21_9BACT|nr:two-component regulator propeller domain-containing protein [Maribellus comscasis]QGY45076.1 response regulator [Maribellus comscasis]
MMILFSTKTKINIVFQVVLLTIVCCFPVNADEGHTGEQYKFMHIDINDGLSNNQVRAILRDSRGFMWFGTDRGLNRFDGTNFKIYLNNLYDSTSIPFNSIDFLFEDIDQNIWIRSLQNFVIYDPKSESFKRAGNYYKNTSIPLNTLQNLFKDSAGNMWFVNRDFGLYKYSPKSEKTDSIPYPRNPGKAGNNNYLYGIDEDSQGNLWVISNSGVVQKIAPSNFQILEEFELDKWLTSEIYSFSLFVDSDDDVWICSPGSPNGVFHISSSANQIQNYTNSSYPIRLNNNLVSSVEEDENGKIWLATDHGGINIIDKEHQSVSYIVNNRDDRYSISQNSVTYLFKDSEEIIWAGTYKKGLSYYHSNLIRFGHVSHIPSDPNSLPYNDVNCFVEDGKGNLWIGTNGGGLIYFDRKNNSYKTFTYDPNNPESISNNVIVSLFIDRAGILWIGTYFGGLNRFDGKKFKTFRHDPSNPWSLADDRVWEIYEDSKQNLWIGTLNGGLDLFDREKTEFYHYNTEDINSVGSNFVVSIIEDSQNNLWLGTSDGLDRLDLGTKRFYHYTPEPGTHGKLSDKNAIDLLEDGRGFIWIATHQGLNVLDRNESRFRVLTEKDGLASSNIKTIQEDQQGNIWISTTNGISKISVVNTQQHPSLDDLNIKVNNYNILDGLQGKEFNEKAVYRTRSGELIFGGANGFNLFIPEKIKEQNTENKIILTEFKVFNQNVPVNVPFRNRIILEKSITEYDKITLRHNENVFSFEFAALNFFHPEKNSFEYRLTGFNDEWLPVDERLNDITFTNLNAGEYELEIRVTGDGDEWTEMRPPLTIEILPPFWKSIYAFVLYFVLFAALVLFSRRIMLERHRLKFEAEQEHREAERIQQLDALKTKFFTNVSHEFRTPLSLIISPIEKLISQTHDEKNRNHLILVQRNARRLLTMVNQLLDFRKMEVQKPEAKKNWGDMVKFIHEVSLSFEDLAQNKQIEFDFKSKIPAFFTFFDKDKTDKIITNLLSNAFKFTPEKGKVNLDIEIPDQNTESKTATVQITVKDTGIGIAPEQQTRIFDRFYQNDLPNSITNQGSGIGLSMVNEYVTILGGTVKVESIVGKGSTFTVQLPAQLFSKEEIDSYKNQVTESKKELSQSTLQEEEITHSHAKKTVLLVEDNPDFRFYLKDNLKKLYNIFEAENGEQGWELTESKLPDMVVSDIMMPVMDGLKLCTTIKTNRKTKHIPVILLTAKTETEPVVEGFESGADDYISKPFDFRILESRIENLINTREQLRLSYQSMIGINPEKIEVNSQDEKFIKKALQTVETYISESSFTVEDLSKELGMSRVSLYKKMVALTGKTPIEFIRIIRLKRAADLLQSSQLTVSEIAYHVGFNNPRYFSKYFEEFYGELPSGYITKHRLKNINISDDTRKKFS